MALAHLRTQIKGNDVTDRFSALLGHIYLAVGVRPCAIIASHDEFAHPA